MSVCRLIETMTDSDDWGCVSEEDLFFSCGSTKSLDELVESIVCSPTIEDLPVANDFPLADGSHNVQVNSFMVLWQTRCSYIRCKQRSCYTGNSKYFYIIFVL